MHARIGVHLVDGGFDGRLRGEFLQLVRPNGDAERFRALARRALVRQIVGARAHAHEREGGRDARAAERVDARGQVEGHALDNGLALQ